MEGVDKNLQTLLKFDSRKLHKQTLVQLKLKFNVTEVICLIDEVKFLYPLTGKFFGGPLAGRHRNNKIEVNQSSFW